MGGGVAAAGTPGTGDPRPDDVLSSADWDRRRAGQAADGDYVELADAHTFPWGHPSAWLEPVRAFAGRLP